MNLYGESWEFTERGGYVVLAFTMRPPRQWRDPVKAHGFKQRTPLEWVRKADANGRAAAVWLEKRLGELCVLDAADNTTKNRETKARARLQTDCATTPVT